MFNGDVYEGIAFGVEQGDFVGNVHQLGDLLRGKFAQFLHHLHPPQSAHG